MNKLLFLLLTLSTPVYAVDPQKPDVIKTPGAILTTERHKICIPGYSKSVRDVSAKTKRKVFSSYGYPHYSKFNRKDFEVDHLISLQLGGSNDEKNLWPQSYKTLPFNAKKKDKLENVLHRLICDGKIPVVQAQKEIATDWTKAYNKYVQ